jgi:hypothetical protein
VFCSVVVAGGGHEGSSGVALQSTAGAGGVDDVVVDGQVPSEAGAEPSGHVCGVAVGQLPLASGVEPSGHVCCVVVVVVDDDDGVFSPVDGGGVVLLPLLSPLLPPPPLLSLLLPPLPLPPLLSLLLPPLSFFFANARFTFPATNGTADSDDTSVSTRNTKIIFLAG